MDNEIILQVLLKTFLFRGMDKKKIKNIINEISYEVIKYEKNDLIYSNLKNNEKFGIILWGSSHVIQHGNNQKKFILNKLIKFDNFGIASLFCENHQLPSSIKATENTGIMFINKTEFKKLLIKSDIIFNNYLLFTSDRIQFLNDRIYLLSMGSGQEKLCHYLLNEYLINEEKCFHLKFTKTDLAKHLSMGRQSLYREIAYLEKANILKITGNNVKLLDIEKIKNILSGENYG